MSTQLPLMTTFYPGILSHVQRTVTRSMSKTGVPLLPDNKGGILWCQDNKAGKQS